MGAVQVFDKSPTAGEIELWPKLKLTAHQAAQWRECKAAMLWACPAFSDIWLSLMVDKDHEEAWFTDCIETAATDDKFLYINPTWFFALTLDEQLFVLCHEVLHAIFNHAGAGWMCGKEGSITYSDGLVLPYDGELANIAMDYVINDQLVKAKIGKMPVFGLHEPAIINGDMSWLDGYRIVYRVHPPGRKNRPSPWGQCLRPGQGRGKSPNKAVSERSKPEWDATITAAMESAKLRGQLPENLARMFTKRLNPKADWRDLYQLAVSRRVGNDRYTWDRLDQQLAHRRIGAPGRTSFGCELVAIAVDTSGSITQATLDIFLAETVGLLEQARPKRIIFMQCDAKVQQYENIEGTDDLFGRKLKGGGGTAFGPVMERLREEGEQPDILIYFTDLYGSFPMRPTYPVVWAVVDNKDPEPPPFGELVVVPPHI